MKSDLYFRHDVYTLDDSEVMALVYRHHEAGYGVFWAVVERLTAETEHRMPKEMLVLQVSVKLMATKPAKVREIVDTCIELGLLKEEDGKVFNERVLRQCDLMRRYSEQQAENVRKRWDKRQAVQAEENTDREEAVEARRNEKKEIAQSVIDKYHQLCPSLPHVRTLTDARISHCYAFAGFFASVAIEEGFKKAEASSFLKNGNGTWNGANLDWLVNRNNFSKVLEGNYDDRMRRQSSVCNDPARLASGTNANGGFEL